MNLSHRQVFRTAWSAVVLIQAAGGMYAQTAAPVEPAQPAIAAPAPAAKASTGFYREPGTVGTKRESLPPAYVRNLSKTGIDAVSDIKWLDIGLDHRIRWEHREDDFRRPEAGVDDPFLFKTRAYLGIKEIIDPLRMVVEFQDSRRYNSEFAPDNRDFNEFEPIQMYGELYFKDLLGKDALGQDRPLSLRGGRMWFELLDRRLIANNAWRNTTNTFQGVALTLGRDVNDFSAEFLAVQPLDRLKYNFDRTHDGQWFFAAIGHWRGWSDIATIEPYYLLLSQEKSGGRTEREIHAPALRVYGPIGTSGFNYDVNLVYQFGDDNGRDHEAFGSTTEVGYTFRLPWTPRLSASYGYGSGDRDPKDDTSERFDRFYGFARPWSSDDYIIWENIHAPKARLEIQPIKDLRIDTGVNAYFLASDRDRWSNANLRDQEGQSGDFIGHDFDIRARYPLGSRIDATVGYSHFTPGSFTKRVGRDDDSDFFYIELVINAFAKS